MHGLAGPPDTWTAISPMTNSSDIIPPFIGQKYISSPVYTLHLSHQLPGISRQGSEIDVVGNKHKHINVFKISLRGHDGSQKRDADYTIQFCDLFYESLKAFE